MSQAELWSVGEVRNGVDSGAIISACGRYRYRLWRAWGPGLRLPFLMLNPSTADAIKPDPTVTRCIGFAKREGFDGIEIVNLFAWRTPYPRELEACVFQEAVGPDNDPHIEQALDGAALAIAAWGVPKSRQLERMVIRRSTEVMAHFGDERWRCLGRGTGTRRIFPRHPLMLPASAPLGNWF